jgi:hypothetical protein
VFAERKPYGEYKMKRIFIIIFAFLTLTFIVSCASSPKKLGEAAKEDKRVEEKKATQKADESTTEDQQSKAESALTSAKDIKADVAMKEDFQKALSLYERALNEKEKGNYKKASDLFAQAKDLFDEVYRKTEEKRTRAAKSIEESNSQLQMLEKKAKEEGI